MKYVTEQSNKHQLSPTADDANKIKTFNYGGDLLTKITGVVVIVVALVQAILDLREDKDTDNSALLACSEPVGLAVSCVTSDHEFDQGATLAWPNLVLIQS